MGLLKTKLMKNDPEKTTAFYIWCKKLYKCITPWPSAFIPVRNACLSY